MTEEFRILVVEDDNILRKVVVSLFAKIAHVGEAESGNDAIRYLKKNRVDLIFTDVTMPDGSGVELLEWAQAAHQTAPIIVLVTGETQIAIEDALAKGAHAVVDKPFKLSDLRQIALQIKMELESGQRPRPSRAG